MYASSLSNHGSAELQQQSADGDGSKRESNILSINSQSIAICHSVPLSYCSQGSGCDERGGDRPIHPFDTDADIQPHVPATLHTPKQSTRPESDILASITDMYIHPLTTTDISRQSDINFQTSSQIQISVPDILSRSGSSRSQETIENWRIHVEPSSPVMHDLDYDFEKLQQEATDTAAQYARSQTGYVYDSEMSHSQKSRSTFGYQAEESQSRRETIPIILSSQLQDAFASHVPDQHFDIYADDDLDIPRPFYAYGQTRAQRQGSINSSIGGYNYSVASSPSLADSLSNPMYHQQTIGIMGGSPFGRAIPVRKGSLPSSIHSSIRDDASSRVQPTCSTSASKIRTRTPSHLSNMLNRGDKDIDSDREAGRATGHKRLPSVQMKSHFRNHSLGTHSSGHGSCSSWEDFRGYKGTQVSYATSVNIQTSYPQRMIYQERGFSIVPNQHINMSESSTAIDLKETLVVDASTQEGYRSTCEHESQYLASSPYTGEMADRFVQPVELSRLLIQPQSGDQREHRGRGYVATTSTPDHELHDSYQPSETQAAWSETCIGLGLTFATDTHQGSAQEGEISAFGTTDGSQLYQPIPVRRAPARMDVQPNSNTWDNDFRSASAVLYEQAGSNTRMTSGLTITTTAIKNAGSPDATTLTNASYRQQPIGAGTTFNDNDSGTKGQNTQHYHVQKQQTSEQGLQRLEQSQRQKLYAVHHQTAQRSRKKLVVNIVPLMN
ncbi:hypothetical protein BGZ98_006980 [Dissophora globulifera]|nr:hypothetical protein BGZ98_006980 [Dissophora globulifera]